MLLEIHNSFETCWELLRKNENFLSPFCSSLAYKNLKLMTHEAEYHRLELRMKTCLSIVQWILFCFVADLRKVYPYYFTFTTFTKGRWVGERILDVFAREFRAHPAEEYVIIPLFLHSRGRCKNNLLRWADYFVKVCIAIRFWTCRSCLKLLWLNAFDNIDSNLALKK